MQTIAIAQAKNNFSAMLHMVESGEDIVLTRHGKAIARIVPETPEPGVTAQEVDALRQEAMQLLNAFRAKVAPGVALPVTALVATARNYTARSVVVEGVITRECTEKGCWMQVAPTADTDGMRVTFKDYAFFIPQSMIGRRARMQGVTKVTTHSKASADHLISEGANLTRNADGTATEVAFEASGVELHR